MKLNEVSEATAAKREKEFRELFTPELFITRYDDVMSALAKTLRQNKLILVKGILSGTLDGKGDEEQDEWELKLISKYLQKYGETVIDKYRNVICKITSGIVDPQTGKEERHSITVSKARIFHLQFSTVYNVPHDPSAYRTTKWKKAQAASAEEAMQRIDEFYELLKSETVKMGAKPGVLIAPKR